MQLREYMFNNRITSSELAKKLECSRALITMAKGGKKVSRRFARDLERVTNGQVTVAEIFAGPIIPFPVPDPEKQEEPTERSA